jgi:hypothetical protein
MLRRYRQSRRVSCRPPRLVGGHLEAVGKTEEPLCLACGLAAYVSPQPRPICDREQSSRVFCPIPASLALKKDARSVERASTSYRFSRFKYWHVSRVCWLVP